MPSPLADDVQQTATRAYGAVPSIFQETNRYTGVPGAVYVAADTALMDGNLTPPEQQAVLLTMARYHDSRYDAVVHARMALDAGLSPQAVEALLDGERLPDDRLQALVEATERSCEERGVGRGELYEIFAFIGLKTMTGFTSHLADPPIDAPLRDVEASLDTVPEKPDTIERQRLFTE